MSRCPHRRAPARSGSGPGKDHISRRTLQVGDDLSPLLAFAPRNGHFACEPPGSIMGAQGDGVRPKPPTRVALMTPTENGRGLFFMPNYGQRTCRMRAFFAGALEGRLPRPPEWPAPRPMTPKPPRWEWLRKILGGWLEPRAAAGPR